MESESEDTCEGTEGERSSRRKPGDRLTASLDRKRRGGSGDPDEEEGG